MPKVSFLKLLDESILPVFIVFGAKIFGLLLANLLFDINWEFGFSRLSLETPFVSYLDRRSLLFGVNFSTLLVLIVIGVCFGWVVFRSQHFHFSHLHPKRAKKLATSRLDSLLVDSFEIYHQAVVWLALSAYILIEIVIQFLAGNITLFVLSFAFGLVFVLVFLLAQDLKDEVKAFK